MLRPHRPVADGLVYHALNRGNNRDAVLTSPEDNRQFVNAQIQTQKRYPFRLFGYGTEARTQSMTRKLGIFTTGHAAGRRSCGKMIRHECR